MSGHVSFVVVGTPAPQGSKRHVGGGRMVESSKAVGPWRDSVAWAVRQVVGDRVAFPEGPVRVEIAFTVPMPKSRRAADRKFGMRWADRRPDLDKLLRSTLDGLTAGGAWGDDCQVVMVHASMTETTGPVRTRIEVDALPSLAEEAS